jgi:hypothetical protein
MFNDDIYQTFIAFSRISKLFDMSLVCKNFNVLCSNTQMWKEKFESIHVNFEIYNNHREYIREYRKITFKLFLNKCLCDVKSCVSDKFMLNKQIDIDMNMNTIRIGKLHKILPRGFIQSISTHDRLYTSDSCDKRIIILFDGRITIIRYTQTVSVDIVSMVSHNYGGDGLCKIYDILYYILCKHPEIKITYMGKDFISTDEYKKYYNI